MSRPRFDPLPESVWHNSVLRLPPRIVGDYQTELENIGRIEDAREQSPRNLIGGADEEAARDHFVWRFGASCVRTEYLILDPYRAFVPVSNDLLSCLAEGRVAILDIPCGAAPGILGFLGLIAELRAHGCLPRQPLEVAITGGDISEPARNIYHAMLTRAQPWLADEGIRIRWQTGHWDAGDESTTAKIVDRWFDGSGGCEEYVVLVAAFSGEAANQFDVFERSFNHIAARLYDRNGTILWVEPRWNKGERLLSKVKRIFQTALGFVRKL